MTHQPFAERKPLMAQRKTGAGPKLSEIWQTGASPRLSGVVERSTPPSSPIAVDTTGEKGKSRNLKLSDSVSNRLRLVAIQHRSTASAIATEILDRHLPRL
jgi:hypothetical protein